MTTDNRSAAEHRNAFGALRLLLASLVIVSHTPELYDGSRHREILTRLFGSISFGELAVDGFFIISGYLVTKSFINSKGIVSFFIKRTARIYPGYILAFMVSLIIFAPFSGNLPAHYGNYIFEQMKKIPFLSLPEIPDAFPGWPYPYLNGVIWTLKYEFQCYIIVALLGVAGAFVSRRLFGLVILSVFFAFIVTRTHLTAYAAHARLIMIFFSGSALFVLRESVRYTWCGALVAAAGVVLSLMCGKYAEAALALCFPYFLFSIAFLNKSNIFSRINNKTDISYGIYLYAWPIEKILFMYCSGAGLLAIGLIDWLGAAFFALLSWFVVEKPLSAVSHQVAKSLQQKNKKQRF